MASPRIDPTKSSKTPVNFVCQRCHQALKLDYSFNVMEQKSWKELTAPPKSSSVDTDGSIGILSSQESLQDMDFTPQPYTVRRYIGPQGDFDMEDELSSDFTLLGETGLGVMENLSLRLKATGYLFDIMSGQSEVDHPLCEECTDTLLDQLDRQLYFTEEECKQYKDFLLNLDNAEEKEDLETLDNELKQLEKEEMLLREQLEKVETERSEMAKLIEKEKETAKQLEVEEEKYWQEYNQCKRDLHQFQDDQRSVTLQLQYAQSQLEKLTKINVFNATFHIWHNGQFVTINNFRLGRLPSAQVDWNEINAAWGQTVLLLHALAKKMNLKFTKYRLVPYGNHSYLESLTDKSKELPLYGSGGFRFFWDTKFDHAMVAFLDCLQEFKKEVEKGDSNFCLPYKMEKGRIEDANTDTSYSIKIQFNSEEQWTKALKYMMTNLRWGLAWVSSQFPNK
ncbi:beclin-1 [Octopus sinensis]|uniref:Beclin-1 n=1 Tax=Octopus sinensis TaxID=2607531 RepID=A0A6P7TEL6_9MOLL|nr:beclin-1 [Octopus sinensis]